MNIISEQFTKQIMNTPRYNITIKEYGRSKPLHTAHIGREMTEQEVILSRLKIGSIRNATELFLLRPASAS